MTIQFDRGTIWQRDLGEPPPAIPDRSYGRPSAKINAARIDSSRIDPSRIDPSRIESTRIDKTNKRVSAPVPGRPAPAAPATTAFDGDWSVVIMTQSGGCDRAY